MDKRSILVVAMLMAPATAAAVQRPVPPRAVVPGPVDIGLGDVAGLARMGADLADMSASFSGLAEMTALGELPALSSLADLSALSSVATMADPLVMVPGVERAAAPRAPWVQGDPADSIYRAARAAINRNSFSSAAQLFADLRKRYPKSTYVPDAFYWEAFARYRMGGETSLRNALGLLETMRTQYPDNALGTDAVTLATRIRGELARRGDPDAARDIAEIAGDSASVPAVPRAARPPRAPRPPREPRAGRRGDSDEVPAGCSSDDYDDKVAALNALLQMNSERAVPLLKGVLARRDECSAPLRRKAVFLLAQNSGSDNADLLLDVVKNDPDQEVRKQAVFWLGQVNSDRAVSILGDILRTSDDVEMQKRAMFALSQNHSPRATEIIRQYAQQADAPLELRKQAIFDLGQSNSGDNSAFLRNLYGKLTDQELKERVLFSVSQMGGAGSAKWLLDIATNANEPLEMRKKALFWAGQQNETDFSSLSGLYDKVTDRELKKQLIFVYSQRNESQAVDRLLEIAQKEQDRELRKQAIFWLSQSHDPRVSRFLEDILAK